MTMEPQIQEVIGKFYRKLEKDPELKEKVMPITKTLNIDLGDEKYSLRMEKAEILDFKPELIENPDITVTTTPEYLQQLIDGTLRPMKAYVTRKVQVKGKIEDLLHLRKVL